MLFLKPIETLDYEDVAKFCETFREDIRVEYKSTFDQNVKKKLPRVLSAFANSYGGVLIIGVNAKSGVPEQPIIGIKFEDPEPRLTVENICRANIFPEVTIYSKVVSSSAAGNAFLVLQVNESPRAPHAIENTTQVYVRSGDSVDRTKLADLALIERLLSRRREVLTRWDEFYSESTRLAEVLGIRKDSPLLELRVGPLYPTEEVINRESVLAFMTNYQMQNSLGFDGNSTFRHPRGAILARQDSSSKYMNIGELATVHYIEPLRQWTDSEFAFTQAGGERIQIKVFPLWWITAPMLKAIDVAANLFKCSSLTCDVRIEAALRNVSRLPFTLALTSRPFDTLEVYTVAANIPASVTHPSESLAEKLQQITTELLYQLRWPFGTEEPQTREQIEPIVAKLFPSAKVRY
jgi:hypothetical protein